MTRVGRPRLKWKPQKLVEAARSGPEPVETHLFFQLLIAIARGRKQKRFCAKSFAFFWPF